MIVRREGVAPLVKKLFTKTHLAFDTETTGLYPHQGDRLFSLIIADNEDAYYFNFQAYPGLNEGFVLSRQDTFLFLAPLFARRDIVWAAHNMKFDLAMLANEGASIAGKLHCTEVNARLIYNAHMTYGLDACVKRDLGLAKSTAVDDYIAEHKLFDVIQKPHKKQKEKVPHYDKVPFPIISEYGETDGRITYKLFMWQLARLQTLYDTTPTRIKSLRGVYENEQELVRVCAGMETAGIKINRPYCEQALIYELQCADHAAAEFERLAGTPFKDSNKALALAFDTAGEKYPLTEKGNPSFTDDVLEGFTSPLAKLVQTYRKSSKKANTYYRNFLDYADDKDRLHAIIRQAGTDTGRFSYAEPNLQNLPKKEDPSLPFHVRRAIIPSPEHCLVMIDYQQMEYRLMLEYAQAPELVDMVVKQGLDVHDAAGKLLNVERDKAKTLNFMIIYGGGIGKLAASLGITLEQAQILRRKYSQTFGGIDSFSRGVIEAAKAAGFITNWAGFRCYFPNQDFCYVGPNHLIQGGCAQVIRRAMVTCAKILEGKKSRMLVQVHDELLFDIHVEELHLVPLLQAAMESAYPHKKVPLLCDVSHSWKSWGDKVKGMPKLSDYGQAS